MGDGSSKDDLAYDIIKEAIKTFQKSGGSIEDRLEVAEGLMAQFADHLKYNKKSIEYLVDSIKILTDAIKSLRERVVVTEEAVTSIYKAWDKELDDTRGGGTTPPPKSPKEQN